MATKIAGEQYRGVEGRIPLGGDISVFVWPLRILANGTGGPTFGVDVGGEEVLRWDCHGEGVGHWHKGGYDKLGARDSRQDFPDGVDTIMEQVSWSLEQLEENCARLLEEAGHSSEVLSPILVHLASDIIDAHLEEQAGGLRSQAEVEGLIKV